MKCIKFSKSQLNFDIPLKHFKSTYLLSFLILSEMRHRHALCLFTDKQFFFKERKTPNNLQYKIDRIVTMKISWIDNKELRKEIG